MPAGPLPSRQGESHRAASGQDRGTGKNRFNVFGVCSTDLKALHKVGVKVDGGRNDRDYHRRHDASVGEDTPASRESGRRAGRGRGLGATAG